MVKKKNTMYKPPKKSNKGFILIIGAIFVLAAVLLFIINNQDSKKQGNTGGTGDTGDTGQEMQVTYEDQPSVGNEDAPVKLVEFFDFKCPHCAAFAEQVYPMIKKDFIDTGKAQMFFINKPFIAPDSKTAAMVGEAVYAQKPEAFIEYYDTVLHNQGDESKSWATEEYLTKLVKDNVDGIDIDQLKKDMDSDAVKNAVETDTEMSTQVQSTPTILVDGKQVELDYENSIKPAIEKALKEADEQ